MVEDDAGRSPEVAASATAHACGGPLAALQRPWERRVAADLGPEVQSCSPGDVVGGEPADRGTTDHHADRRARCHQLDRAAEGERSGNRPEVTGRDDDDHGAASSHREPDRLTGTVVRPAVTAGRIEVGSAVTCEVVATEVDDDDLVRTSERTHHVCRRVADQAFGTSSVGAEHACAPPGRQQRGELVSTDLAARGVEVGPAQASLVLDAEQDVESPAGEVCVDEGGLCASCGGDTGDRGGEHRRPRAAARTDDADDRRVVVFS